MIDVAILRELREEVEDILSSVTENALYSHFSFMRKMPEAKGQFWEYELVFWTEDDDFRSFPCGCFVGPGTFRNVSVDINTFFDNNDKLLAEFIDSIQSGFFQELAPVLNRIEGELNHDRELRKDGSGVALNLCSYVTTDDAWIRGVCDEYILIAHLSEERVGELEIGCQQNERYRIKVKSDMGDTYFYVPFDKVKCFKNHERVEGVRNTPYRKYQVALSFAGENRDYVSEVARILRQKRVRVFYDEYETASLWGKDLYAHLDDVYRKQAQYCVVFLSQHYAKKLWTNHERESAQARAFDEQNEYILPVKLDEIEIPGIRPTLGYVEKTPPEKLADLIFRKINGFCED
ncbi:toll/interleukin-1 receptor domain-containing protein [Halomonas daqiaonensis]|uniref:TIR domain-containing protein n=1 Tax=Halomonas daqiaonensis TaxID=650850 RepID=A0A1H7VJ75_9GAMM|nr:TIR domain-containing protein [Halomonas daqiaonensis]SEM09322.1 TIR domain-containing protein [Halomonas daqiaonensis]